MNNSNIIFKTLFNFDWNKFENEENPEYVWMKKNKSKIHYLEIILGFKLHKNSLSDSWLNSVNFFNNSHDLEYPIEKLHIKTQANQVNGIQDNFIWQINFIVYQVFIDK